MNATAKRAVAQGGVTWGEFNRATQQHGLATTGGVVSSTGIAGLTLGGGYGYLAGKHGLATIIWWPQRWLPHREKLFVPVIPRIPISTGRCAAEAATSVWSHLSSTAFILLVL